MKFVFIVIFFASLFVFTFGFYSNLYAANLFKIFTEKHGEYNVKFDNEKTLNENIIDLVDSSNQITDTTATPAFAGNNARVNDATIAYNLNSGKALYEFEKSMENSTQEDLKQIHSLIPSNYLESSAPERSDLPIVKYSREYSLDEKETSSISSNATNIILDLVFSSITNDIFTMNILQRDKNTGLLLQIKPLRNLIVEFSQVEEDNKNSTGFKVQLFPTKTTAITFLTTDNATETQTGIEFQMKF